MFENFHLGQQLDKIVTPTTNMLLRIRVAHGTIPLNNCLAAVFVLGLNKASYLLVADGP